MKRAVGRVRFNFVALLALMLALSLALSGCVVAPYPGHRHGGYVGAPQRPMPPPQPVAAQPMYFYPELSQGEAQQDRDRYECYRWATRETGFDPGMTPVREAPVARRGPPAPDGAEVAGGAITGAVVGSVLSSPRSMGEGAIIGAIFGAIVGAAASDARQRAQSQSYDAAEVERTSRPMGNFRRAMTACMEGRGYRVR